MSNPSTPPGKHPGLKFSIVELVFASISLIILVSLATTIAAFQLNQMNRVSTPAGASTSSSSNSNTQSNQILSEAQQDISVATDVITWSGFFITFLGVAVTILGFFGIREFRHIQDLRTQIGEDHKETQKLIEADRKAAQELKTEAQDLKEQVLQELNQAKNHFEKEGKTFLEITYNRNAGNDAYKRGDNKLAIEYYLRVLKWQPDDKQAMERLSRAYSNMNEMPAAINYLQRVLDIDPADVPALRSLGLCYRYTDPAKAIEQFKLALANKPDDYEALDFLGLVYRDNGQMDKAIEAHEKALAIKRRPETQFYLSLLYAKRGGKDDRNRALRMALNAEDDLNVKDPNEEIRPVWQLVIRAGARILQDNEDKAYELVLQLRDQTSQRTANALTGHLKFLLEATGHRAWIDRFTSVVKVK